MSSTKMYQTVVRVRGTDEWTPVTYSDLRYYCEEVELLEQMTDMMRRHFRSNEYRVEVVNVYE